MNRSHLVSKIPPFPTVTLTEPYFYYDYYYRRGQSV